MITKEMLKKYANKLMFDMNDEEYETLLEEFDVILKQMDLIGEIENISNVVPMTFPYINNDASLSEDEVIENDALTIDEVLSNAKSTAKDQVKVPRVVEE